MKQVAILMDYQGRELRKKTLEDAGIEVHSMYNVPFDVPGEWFPDRQLPNWKKEWFKCDAQAFAFIRHLAVAADFYWIIEADVAGPVARWQALFADPVSTQADGVFICHRTRAMTLWNPWWSGEWTDQRATHTHLQSIYGLSSRALAWCIEDAPERRNVFCEMCTASSIVAHGGTLTTINRNTTHCNNQTMKASVERVLFNKRLLNHPIKPDSYGVDGLTFK